MTYLLARDDRECRSSGLPGHAGVRRTCRRARREDHRRRLRRRPHPLDLAQSACSGRPRRQP